MYLKQHSNTHNSSKLEQDDPGKMFSDITEPMVALGTSPLSNFSARAWPLLKVKVMDFTMAAFNS